MARLEYTALLWAFGCGNQYLEMAIAHPGGRLHLLYYLRPQTEVPYPVPTLHRRMLHWAEPASEHPLEVPPPPDPSPQLPFPHSRCLQGFVTAGSQARSGTPAFRPSGHQCRVSAQPGPVENRTQSSCTHLTPTARSASLPVDLYKQRPQSV